MSKDFSLKFRCGPIVTTLAACGMVSSCGAPAGHAEDQPSAPKKVFSEADRKVAVALSVGRPALLQREATEYDKAILCKIALDSISLRLREMSSPEHAAQLSQMEARLAERAYLQGSAAGKNRAQVDRDLAAKAAESDDPSILIPVAMACLRTIA
jgi:hypothetical protein